ncbi:MAG: prolipoprotein diacylglyceryl transferase [Patescibacteria group bacterium]
MLALLHNTVPNAIAVTIGPVPIRWYGIMLTVGVVAGYFLARYYFGKAGHDKAKFDNLFLPLVLIGLLGARLTNVFLFEWWYFKNHLSEIFYIWQGGLAFHGAIIFGGVYLWWWCKKQSINFLSLLDILAPALAAGQAIGRFGNYFNQELFGLPTNLPWGIPIAPEFRPNEFSAQNYFHPTFLYESIGLVILTIILLLLGRRLKPVGSIFAYYLIGSGLLRFALEFIRVDEQLMIVGIRIGLLISLLVIVIGIVLIYKSYKRGNKLPTT